jgi:hypothetical protein
MKRLLLAIVLTGTTAPTIAANQTPKSETTVRMIAADQASEVPPPSQSQPPNILSKAHYAKAAALFNARQLWLQRIQH